MKFALIAVALLCLALDAGASPYFRLIDPSHPHIGAGFLISPKSPSETVAITDLAMITHSSTDGTIIPASWQSYVPPESWSPLSLALGGSMTGSAVLGLGASANVAPILGGLLLHGVDASSSGWAKAIKTALLGQGQGSVRLGGALAASVVQNGHFQNAATALPGRGVLDIVGNAARLDAGYSWKF